MTSPEIERSPTPNANGSRWAASPSKSATPSATPTIAPPASTARASWLDHFERTITVEGDVDEQQRASLERIADKCPVHRTLEDSARLTTTLSARP